MPRKRNLSLTSRDRKRNHVENEPEKLERRRERELKKLEDCWSSESNDINRASSKEDRLCTRSRARNTPTKMIDASKPGYSSPKQGTEIVSTDTCREIDINIAQSSKPNENQETDWKAQQTRKRQLFDDFTKSLNLSNSMSTQLMFDLTEEGKSTLDGSCSIVSEDGTIKSY